MYLLNLENVLWYLLVLLLSYFMIRGMINLLHLGKSGGLKPFIIALILSPISLWLFFQFLDAFISYQPEQYFSSSGWKNNTQVRFRMTNDLLGENLLIGKDTVALKKMLGEPEIRSTVPEEDFQWQYQMGSSGVFLFHFLIVKGKNNAVQSAEHLKIRD